MIDLLNIASISEVTFPQNKIILLNGKELLCHPKADQTDDVEKDDLTLDNTGQYLTLENQHGVKLRNLRAEEDKRRKEERDKLTYFMQNAYFFLNNADAVFSDSRMFLAPVTAPNGLAYTGESGLRNPTLGIYLEWWMYGEEYNTKDPSGNDALTCVLSGSPLSGSNSCYGVYPDGKMKTIKHNSFGYLWRSFMSVNARYSEAKQQYDAYSLEEVFDILKAAEQDEASMLRTKLLISEGNAASLMTKLSRLSERYDSLSKKHEEVCIENSKKELEAFSEEYNKKAEQAQQDVEMLNEQRRALKTRLKSGEITNIEYQKLLRPIKKQKEEVKWSLNSFCYDKTTKLTEKGYLTMSMIHSYIWDHATDIAKESLRFV